MDRVIYPLKDLAMQFCITKGLFKRTIHALYNSRLYMIDIVYRCWVRCSNVLYTDYTTTLQV